MSIFVIIQKEQGLFSYFTCVITNINLNLNLTLMQLQIDYYCVTTYQCNVVNSLIQSIWTWEGRLSIHSQWYCLIEQPPNSFCIPPWNLCFACGTYTVVTVKCFIPQIMAESLNQSALMIIFPFMLISTFRFYSVIILITNTACLPSCNVLNAIICRTGLATVITFTSLPNQQLHDCHTTL